MAPPAMKRPAAAAASSSAAKKPKKAAGQDPELTAKVNAVCAALTSAQGLPRELLGGMAAAAKVCLATPKASRHESQQWVVTSVGQVLQEQLAKQKTAVDSLKAKVEESAARKEELAAACTAASTAATEQVQAEVAAHEAFEAQQKELEKALDTVATEEKSMQEMEDKLGKTNTKKLTLESAKETFVALQTGALAKGKAKAIKGLMKVGKDCAFDSALLVAAPASLEKDAGDRTGFDGLVFDQVETHIKNGIAKAEEDLANAAPARSAQTAAVEGARAQREVAIQKEFHCRQQWEVAKKAVKAAEKESRAAEAAAKNFSKEIAAFAAELDQTNARVTDCEGTLSSFAELEALPVPEPPAPEAEEQVADSAQGEAAAAA